MTNDINKWPITDNDGKFVFCDGYGSGYNVTFEFVVDNLRNRKMTIRVIEIQNDKVVDESDPLEITNAQGVRLSMEKKSKTLPLMFRITGTTNNNYTGMRKLLDLSGAAGNAENFDGKFSRLLDKTILPGYPGNVPPGPPGPACGFIGVTDAREVTATNTLFVAVNLDTSQQAYRVKVFFDNVNGMLEFTSETGKDILYYSPPSGPPPAPPTPAPYPLKHIPVPKWGKRMTIQHY